jgi:hypothetical protein
VSLRQRTVPAGLLRGDLEHTRVAGRAREEGEAVAEGILTAAWASSSIIDSIANAVWLFPPSRHHRTVIGRLGEWSVTRRAGMAARYGRVDDALDRGLVDAVLHHDLERSSGEDGLSRRACAPGHRAALRVEPGLDAVVERGR